ncbi:UvrD-helicase domain-containing protein [Clostridium prolinivorans]|uniref:UvrD-helicase domain-containing protein n=1 Tax=Clostridium prolinivorans TaxID=2769420 RepID=UPI000FDC6EF9|nr:ATP-dependent helicase [Clostridium prolinivorans]
MIRYTNCDKWFPSDGIELEDAAYDSVKTDTNCIVIAGPGAGKTELLAQKACYLLETNKCPNPQKILAISFKKDAARNLAERVEKRCGKELSKRFISRTYDSFAKHLVDHFRMSIPENYRPPAEYNIASHDDIESLIKHYDLPHDIENEYGIHEVSTTEFIRFYLTKNMLPIYKEYNNINEWLIGKVWHSLINGESWLTPSLTFPMISRLAEYLLRFNPSIRKALRMTYKYVFLDEFQDTTEVQYDLVKTAFLGSNSILTAVGDDKQRIMNWAGAMEDIFNTYKNDFAAVQKELIMNHRSAPRLVAIQKVISHAINGRVTDIKTNKKWNREDGICENWIFDNEKEEAEIVCGSIKTWLEEEDISPRDICIIAKQNVDTYSKLIVEGLKLNNIKARNEANLQDLLSDEVAQAILNIIILSNDKQAPVQWVEVVELFKMLKGYDDDSKEEKIIDLEMELNKFLVELKSSFETTANKEQLKEIINRIIKYLGESIISGIFPQYKNLSNLYKLIDDLTSNLWKEYSEVMDWIQAVNELKGVNSIPIMTIHKSKGLEYDTVIFVGLEDGAFWSFRQQQQEDMCAFFVALSRAKRRAIFTFSNLRTDRFNRTRIQSRAQIRTFYDLLSESQVVDEVAFTEM